MSNLPSPEQQTKVPRKKRLILQDAGLLEDITEAKSDMDSVPLKATKLDIYEIIHAELV